MFITHTLYTIFHTSMIGSAKWIGLSHPHVSLICQDYCLHGRNHRLWNSLRTFHASQLFVEERRRVSHVGTSWHSGVVGDNFRIGKAHVGDNLHKFLLRPSFRRQVNWGAPKGRMFTNHGVPSLLIKFKRPQNHSTCSLLISLNFCEKHSIHQRYRSDILPFLPFKVKLCIILNSH